MKSEAYVPPFTARYFGPGQVCLDALAGDLVLVGGGGFVAKGIRAFEGLRIPRRYCWTNHACVAMSSGPNAEVVQETAKGSVSTPLASLVAEHVAVIHHEVAADQIAAGLRFLARTLGSGYGWLTIPADALNALTGMELGLGIGGRMVCSTQACRYLERLGLVPDRSPYAVTPAHLAMYHDAVLAPERS